MRGATRGAREDAAARPAQRPQVPARAARQRGRHVSKMLVQKGQVQLVYKVKHRWICRLRSQFIWVRNKLADEEMSKQPVLKKKSHPGHLFLSKIEI